ncbi:hypothetical protein CMUS01_13550 [Colletotrichum musicola]|uniref:Uncharacterized protein n=1 Tax=Colletotrichum musicola TaxID=2175873 RepID=A0A8H6JBR8_9PEZI|nr:hypothetical protein CMUS01_13550 [Colletotrichum musicola]
MTVGKPDHVLYSAQGFQVPTRAADGGVTDSYAFQFGGSRGHRAPLPEAEDRCAVAARNCSAAERASSTRIAAEVPAYGVTLIEGTYFGLERVNGLNHLSIRLCSTPAATVTASTPSDSSQSPTRVNKVQISLA